MKVYLGLGEIFYRTGYAAHHHQSMRARCNPIRKDQQECRLGFDLRAKVELGYIDKKNYAVCVETKKSTTPTATPKKM